MIIYKYIVRSIISVEILPASESDRFHAECNVRSSMKRIELCACVCTSNTWNKRRSPSTSYNEGFLGRLKWSRWRNRLVYGNILCHINILSLCSVVSGVSVQPTGFTVRRVGTTMIEKYRVRTLEVKFCYP